MANTTRQIPRDGETPGPEVSRAGDEPEEGGTANGGGSKTYADSTESDAMGTGATEPAPPHSGPNTTSEVVTDPGPTS